jgi:hypothetical protein
MLKDEVVQAVRDGTFRVYEIDRVEEGVEVLMGIPAGEIGSDGKYPEGTLYRKVADRIVQLREAVREQSDDDGKRKKEDDEAEGKKG